MLTVALPGGRCLMEPMVFARLVQALDIGSTSNYCWSEPGAAMARPFWRTLQAVIAVEGRAQLVEKAQEALVNNGIDNAVVIKSRLVDGYPEEGPYDRIMIEGAVETVPDALLEQLTASGKLATIYRPNGAPSGVASCGPVRAPPLSESRFLTRACRTLTNLPKT